MGRPSDQSAEITELLHQWREGSTEAERRLFELVTPNLKRLAHYLMRRERRDNPLQATELVSEAYLRLITARDRDWQNRKQFFAIAARAMRRYLIDFARRRKAAIMPLETGDGTPVQPSIDVIALNHLLDELARAEPDWCTVVELKYFLGFTDYEASQEMGIPLRTLQRMWLDARKWLYTRMETRNAQGAGR